MFGYSLVELTEKTSFEDLEYYRENIAYLVEASNYKNAPQRFLQDANYLRGKVVLTHKTKGMIDHMVIAGKLADYRGKTVFHLGLSINLSESKGRNVVAYFILMLSMAIKYGLPVYFTCITNSPRVFGTISEHYSEVYPSSQPSTPQQWHEDLFKIVADKQLPGLTSFPNIKLESQYIIHGMMGDQWDRQIIEHRKQSVNRAFYNLIDPSKGQCLIQAGKYDLKTLGRGCRRFIKKALGLA